LQPRQKNSQEFVIQALLGATVKMYYKQKLNRNRLSRWWCQADGHQNKPNAVNVASASRTKARH